MRHLGIAGSAGSRGAFAGALAAAVNGLLVYALTGLNLAPHLLQLALPMLVLGLTYVLFAAAVALFVGSFSGAAVFTMATTVVLWFLSGATAQIKYATGILRDIALAIPNTYGLSQMRGAVFAMDASVGAFSAFRLAGSSCWAGWRWRRCWPLRSIIENWRVPSDKTLQNSADDKILIIRAVLFMAKNARAD